MEPGGPAASNRLQFSIPEILQIYRQTLYLAVKQADQAATGNAYEEDGVADMRKDLDNWNQIEFDPPGCLRLSKKSGACQKIVSFWKKLLGSVLTDRDPASFGNHDRGVMTICKLLHKDFLIAETAIQKWNDRDFPSIPADQAKEKLSMNQLTFLCRRYHNDLTLIAHAFKSAITSNDFKYLNPRLTETYPIDQMEAETAERPVERSSPPQKSVQPSPNVGSAKAEKRKRPVSLKETNTDKFLSMADMFASPAAPESKSLAQSDDFSMPSPLDPNNSFFTNLANSVGERKASSPVESKPTKTSTPKPSFAENSYNQNRTNGHKYEAEMPASKRMKQDPADQTEIARLKSKNKKYVGMIMALVQQLVGCNQVPFIDLRGIDPEDQEQSIAPMLEQKQMNGSAAASMTQLLNGQRTPFMRTANPVAARRKVPKVAPPPAVTFDRNSMSWNVPTQSTGSRISDQLDTMASPKLILNEQNQRSMLASLLTDPSGSIREFPSSTSFEGGSANGHSSKSKRKNNPVKRENLLSRAPASPDVGIGSDETGSVGSGEHRSVKSSALYVPPVEKSYVESRGRWELNGSQFDDDIPRSSVIVDSVGKARSSLQSMADSLLLANGGLAAMGMKSGARKAPVEDRRIPTLAPGTAVFGKLRDGNKYPGEIVDQCPDGTYVVEWLHTNHTSNVPSADIFAVEELLAPLIEVMYRTDDGYEHCALLEINANHNYTVLNPCGQVKKCRLRDLVIPAKKLFPEKSNGHNGRSVGSMEAFEEPPSPESSSDIYTKNPTITDASFSGPFAHVYFTLTRDEKGGLSKGYEDEDMIALIQTYGGTVVDTIEDLLEAPGEKFLVAPSTCSSSKFLQCLAANIPCISYQWVIDSCTAKEKLDHMAYVLPAGMVDGNVVLWHPRKFLFGTRRLGLYSSGTDFCHTWFLPLSAGGAKVSIAQPENIVCDATQIDLLIVDSTCTDAVKKAVENAGVRVVNETWLKHTLIHGRMQPFDDGRYIPVCEP